MTFSSLWIFADEGRKLPTIGGAIPVDPSTDAPYSGAFRDAMRQPGYVEGKNINIVLRFANGDPAKLRQIIKELVICEWTYLLEMLGY